MKSARGAGIRLTGVTKNYAGYAAVDGVTITVEPGEFLTLLGPSGSGKTTTLMILAGFETPDRGQVWIDDECVTFLPPYHRNLGFVFQHYALFPHLTVAKNLAFPLEMRGMDTAEIQKSVAASLDMVRLPDVGDRYPSQLSGGQQQRIAVARALIYRPPVLLMDEPLGALDKKLRQQMQLEIKRIHDELGITFIYVTHDQEEALTMSDRIAVMDAGKIVQVNTPREIYEKPANQFVANFIGETNILTGPVHDAPQGRKSVLLDTNQSIPLPADTEATAGSLVSVVIRPERVQITAAVPKEDTTRGTPDACLQGEVTDTIYVGERWRYKIRSGETQINVNTNCIPREEHFHVGSTVYLSWNSADSNIVST